MHIMITNHEQFLYSLLTRFYWITGMNVLVFLHYTASDNATREARNKPFAVLNWSD